MSSTAPKFKCIKFFPNKNLHSKMFHVEFIGKQSQRFRPRFFTNKNLFFVKNCNKTKYNIKKHSMKLSTLLKNQKKKNQKNFLKKRFRFITQRKEIKPLISKTQLEQNIKLKLKQKPIEVKENEQLNNIIKEKIKQKFSVIHSFTSNDKTIKSNNSSNNYPKRIIRHYNKNGKYISGRWSVDEHKKFLEAIIKYGNDWKEVQKHIGTRSSSQARSHAQKFFIKLKQEQLKSNTSNEIDYSNSSIKTFHDTLQILSSEKREKIIKELESITFDKETKSHSSYNYSDSKRMPNSEKSGYSSEMVGEETYLMAESSGAYEEISNEEEEMECEEENESNDENKKNVFKRKISLDSMNDIKNIKYSSEFYRDIGHLTEEEYEKSFNMVFSDKEGMEIEPKSRKFSADDDFMYNIKI